MPVTVVDTDHILGSKKGEEDTFTSPNFSIGSKITSRAIRSDSDKYSN